MKRYNDPERPFEEKNLRRQRPSPQVIQYLEIGRDIVGKRDKNKKLGKWEDNQGGMVSHKKKNGFQEGLTIAVEYD